MNYKIINTLEQFIDNEDVVVEETVLVENRDLALRYSLRIVELRNEETILDMVIINKIYLMFYFSFANWKFLKF